MLGGAFHLHLEGEVGGKGHLAMITKILRGGDIVDKKTLLGFGG